MYVLLLLLPACSKERMDFKRVHRALEPFREGRRMKLVQYSVDGVDSTSSLPLLDSIAIVSHDGKQFIKHKSGSLTVHMYYSAPEINPDRGIVCQLSSKDGVLLLYPYDTKWAERNPDAEIGIISSSTNFIPEITINDNGNEVIIEGNYNSKSYHYELHSF